LGGYPVLVVLQIEHPVPDFTEWKMAFDNDPLSRKQAGVRRYRIFRLHSDKMNDSSPVFPSVPFFPLNMLLFKIFLLFFNKYLLFLLNKQI